MKKLALLSMICLFSLPTFSQFEFNNRFGGGIISARDISGQPLIRKYDADIEGSPFLNDSLENAILTLSKGKVIGPVMVKLNIESNELNYSDSAGKEFVADDGVVQKISFTGLYTKDSIRYIFKNGYPAIDRQRINFYYQVLVEGNMELLAKKTKYIRVTRNELSGETTKEFLDAATILYVYTKNTIEEFRPFKSFILTVMRDKEEDITDYMNKNKINLKKTGNVIKLFNYYNALH